MKSASLNKEKRLWKKGFKRVVCIDEAGRGTLAGPVVAAAVMLQIFNNEFLIKKQFQNFKFKKLFKNLKLKIRNLQLRDSKKLSPRKREEFYRILTTHPGIEWSIGKVSARTIDKINILEATKLAMKRAINNLKSKILNPKSETSSKFKSRSLAKLNEARFVELCSSRALRFARADEGKALSEHQKSKIDFLIIDGNFKINLPIPQKSIIKADEKVFSCAAASIIAKVTRDRVMEKYHKKYSYYGFNKHKGYPTRRHIKMLKKYGPCKIHRKTFGPVRALDFEKQSR